CWGGSWGDAPRGMGAGGGCCAADGKGSCRRRPVASPARVDARAQQLVVGLVHGGVEALEHGPLRVGGRAAGGGVAAGLLAAAGPGDGGGDAGLREDPAQARLRERHLAGERLLEPCHGRQPRPVLHAGEGLALAPVRTDLPAALPDHGQRTAQAGGGAVLHRNHRPCILPVPRSAARTGQSSRCTAYRDENAAATALLTTPPARSRALGPVSGRLPSTSLTGASATSSRRWAPSMWSSRVSTADSVSSRTGQEAEARVPTPVIGSSQPPKPTTEISPGTSIPSPR